MHVTGHELVVQYGPAGLFALLMFGIIGVPVPDEVLMTTAGILIRTGELPAITTGLAGLAGSSCGITVSYLIGLIFGRRLIQKYGPRLHVGQARYARFQHWYAKFGRWTLLFGYFVPGFRHVMAIVAGTSGLGWLSFALFAYSGALLWVAAFLTGGYLIGQAWLTGTAAVHEVILIIAGVLALGAAGYFLVRTARRRSTRHGPD